MVKRAFKCQRGATDDQWRVDDVTMPHNPANVGGGPPNVSWLQTKYPTRHADNVNLISAMRVDGELRFGSGARGCKDERRFVRFHRRTRACLSCGVFQEFI